MVLTMYVQALGHQGVRFGSAEELEDAWGDRIRHLGQDNPTAYLLCQALRKLDTPVLVSDAIAGRWLKEYCGISVRTKINNAAHLEQDWGARIREHLAGAAIEPGDLSKWLLSTSSVSVPPRVCQSWLTRDWASSGEFLVPLAVEQELGQKLRLDEYQESFADEANDINVFFSAIISLSRRAVVLFCL